MSSRLRDSLPYSLRLFARRLVAQWTARIVRLIGDALNIATTNGVDLRRELPPQVRAALSPDVAPPIIIQQSIPVPAAVPQSLPPAAPHATPSSNAQEFLFLMEVVGARRRAAQEVEANGAGRKSVQASIIIPVFNKVDFTLQCLRSLIGEADSSENEIIVVNNASEDTTARVVNHFEGLVRLINNRENLGFVEACNQGAAAAHGKYLVFLNNDTVVQPGWLQHLVETVENNEEVGAVGSMLIYPDGRLQEAGSIIWRDGVGWNYGRGFNPSERKFNYAREVDYCSGASLLVRRELFEQLGGFDKRYAPAYYEDADLCFGVRSLGFKVVYQPMSRLVHYEGVTAGTDTHSGYKRYQEINRNKFVDKWRDTLRREQHENNANLVEQVADRSSKPRLMVFDSLVPMPDRDAGSGRMAIILKTLARDWQVVFVPAYRTPYPHYDRLLGQDGIKLAYIEEYEALLETSDFEVAVVSRPEVADVVLPVLNRVSPNTKTVFDTVDIHFLRLEREYKLTGNKSFADEAAMRKKQEIDFSESCNQVWCVTPDDKAVIEREAPDIPTSKIKIIPTIHKLHNRGASFAERQGLFFIGGFNHRPNKDAIHFFMREIYPRICKTLPGVKFNIVGSEMPEEIYAYASDDVATLGYVPNVDELFQQSRVFVAPLRYGAGMKGKIGHALSYGLPVVTTTIGAEGIGLTNNREALVADSPAQFAEAVVKVYQNVELWQRLADNGYNLIEENFAPAIVEQKIQAAVGELRSKKLVTVHPLERRDVGNC